MAYDEELAHRVREQLAEEAAVTEKSMFGGLAFLVGGNMSVAVSGRGGLIVRVGPDGEDEALGLPHARPMDMTGRPMSGWVVVDPAGVRSDGDLRRWVERGVGFARSLPAKG